MNKVMSEMIIGDMATKKKRGRGRPCIGDSPRNRPFQVRMTEAEQRALKALARKRGCAMADLLLAVIRKER